MWDSRRWTPVTLLRRAREVVRAGGLRALWFKVLGETCYRRMWLVGDSLERTFEVPIPSPIAASSLTLAEAPSLAALSTFSQGEIERRLHDGEICYLARLGGAIAGWRWYGCTRARVDYLGSSFDLPAGCVYGYDVFVVPEHRRKRVSSTLLSHARKDLVERGFTIRFTAIMPENIEGGGFNSALTVSDPIGYMRVLRLGPLRRAWCSRGDDGLPPIHLEAD